jgi:hypothetical protein
MESVISHAEALQKALARMHRVRSVQAVPVVSGVVGVTACCNTLACTTASQQEQLTLTAVLRSLLSCLFDCILPNKALSKRRATLPTGRSRTAKAEKEHLPLNVHTMQCQAANALSCENDLCSHHNY